MAAPKNPKNGQKNMVKNLKEMNGGEVLPPSLGSGAISAPTRFSTIGDVINEQKRLYKLVFSGDLDIKDLTKLMYALQQIIQGLKAKSEMDVLEDAYTKQWQGVRIIAPPGENVPDPHDVAIEGEILDG